MLPVEYKAKTEPVYHIYRFSVLKSNTDFNTKITLLDKSLHKAFPASPCY